MITRRCFTTHLRTWLLVVGLSGLLAGIGALIGGGALYIFVAIAVLMNLVGYALDQTLTGRIDLRS